MKWRRWGVIIVSIAGIGAGLYTSGALVKGKTLNCFENPETEGTARIAACGYPTPSTVGAEAATGKTCAELPTITGAELRSEEKPKANETIEGKDILLGEITLGIESNNITFNKDCVVANTQTGTNEGQPAIKLLEGEKGFTIENSTIHGENQQTHSLAASGIWTEEESASGTTIKKDVFYWCVECLQGPAEATEDYVIANGIQGKGEESEVLHREDWYVNESFVIAKKDTLINPEPNVAVIFEDQFKHENTPCVDHMTVENSFLAGGNQGLEMCGEKVSETGTATQVIKGNRFARCLGTPEVSVYGYNRGAKEAYILGKGCTTAHSKERCANTTCTVTNETGPYGSVYNSSWDSHGYFPRGGVNGINGCPIKTEKTKCPSGSKLEWEENYWDDNANVVGAES